MRPFPPEFGLINSPVPSIEDLHTDEPMALAADSVPIESADESADEPADAISHEGLVCRNSMRFREPTEDCRKTPTSEQAKLIRELYAFVNDPTRCPSHMRSSNVKQTLAPLCRWIVGEGVQFEYTPTRFKAGECLTLSTDVDAWKVDSKKWMPVDENHKQIEHGWGSTHPLEKFNLFKSWKLASVNTTSVATWAADECDAPDAAALAAVEMTREVEVHDSDSLGDSTSTAVVVPAGARKRTHTSILDRLQDEHRKRHEANRAEHAKQEAVAREAAVRCRELDAVEAREAADYAERLEKAKQSIETRRERDLKNRKMLASRDRYTNRDGTIVYFDTEQKETTSKLLDLFITHVDPNYTLKYLYKGEDVCEHTEVFQGVTRHADFYAARSVDSDGLEIVAECKSSTTNASCDSMYSQLVFYQRALASKGDVPRFFIACYPIEPKLAYMNMHIDADHCVWWPKKGHTCDWALELAGMLG